VRRRWPNGLSGWLLRRALRARVLTGDGGLLTGLVRQVLQTGLEVEMTEHLGYERHAPEGRGSGNSRNGTTPKRVTTEIGEVDLRVPRDRAGTFEPATVPKHRRRAVDRVGRRFLRQRPRRIRELAVQDRADHRTPTRTLENGRRRRARHPRLGALAGTPAASTATSTTSHPTSPKPPMPQRTPTAEKQKTTTNNLRETQGESATTQNQGRTSPIKRTEKRSPVNPGRRGPHPGCRSRSARRL